MVFSKKPNGRFFIVTVTVRLASSPAAVSGSVGVLAPYWVDLFFRSITQLMSSAACRAVSGVPSEQVTSGRSVKVAEPESADHLSARPETNFPSGRRSRLFQDH